MVAPRQWKINLHLIHRQRIVSSSLHDTVGETYTNEKQKKLSWGDKKFAINLATSSDVGLVLATSLVNFQKINPSRGGNGNYQSSMATLMAAGKPIQYQHMPSTLLTHLSVSWEL